MINSLYDLLDSNNLDTYLQKKNMNNEIIKKKIQDIFFTPLTISKLNKIFYINSLNDWNTYKNKCSYLYFNNLKRTILELKNNSNFEKSIECIMYFKDIKEILGEKNYNEFYDTLSMLHYLIHNNGKQECITKLKSKISKYLSLYNAKSKEKFIKIKTNEYKEKYKKYFKIKKSNNKTYQKIIEKKQREKLKNLFEENDEDILNKINNIKNNYEIYAKKLNTSKEELNILLDKYIKLIIEMKVNKVEEIIDITNNNYLILSYLFSKIRRDIIKLAQSLKNIDISEQEISINQDSFDDNNYEFNYDLLKKYPISLIDDYIIKLNKINNTNKQLFIDDNLILFSLITNLEANNFFFNKKDIIDLIDNSKELLFFTKDININNISYLYKLNQMLKKGIINISIIGYEILKKVHDNNAYTYESFDKKIEVLSDLACLMYTQNTSTIPYISGKYKNYKYTTYDNTMYDVFTSGIDTDSCFKATGTENDFFHYTILSKNGINIKITDKNNNLIARVSGYRYGNGVYFNQLRTISNTYIDENIIIEIFKKISKEIINKSYKNEKIEFVVITKTYLMKHEESNISEELSNFITINCIDNKSQDWTNFIKCKNLDESYHGAFINDYGTTDLICVDSIVGELTQDKIKLYSPNDIYKRKRSVVKLYNMNDDIEKQINRIKAIYCYKKNTKYNYIKLKNNEKILKGDNWYIIYGNEIVDSCCLCDDKEAYIEYMISIDYINELLQEKIIKKKTTFS